MLLVLKVCLFHHIIVIKNGFNELVNIILLNANTLYIFEWVRMMQAIRVNGRTREDQSDILTFERF